MIHTRKDKRNLGGPLPVQLLHLLSRPGLTHCLLTVLQVTPPPGFLGQSFRGVGAGEQVSREAEAIHAEQPLERMRTATPSGHILQARGPQGLSSPMGRARRSPTVGAGAGKTTPGPPSSQAAA